LAEAERLARRRLPSFLIERLSAGQGRQVTHDANVEAFNAVGFVHRAATSVNAADLSTTVLGSRVELPVLAAPTGLPRLFHPEGEKAIARATGAVGSIDVASWDTGHSIEDVAAAATGRLWQQVYWSHGRPGVSEVIDRISVTGYEALVVTVDIAVNPLPKVTIPPPSLETIRTYAPSSLRRPRWLSGFLRDRTYSHIRQPHINAGTAGPRLSPTWADLDWLRDQWSRPLIVKGILSVEDARRVADIGANAIVVSNHGGRCLDSLPSTMQMLASIVDAVPPSVEVYLDSGVRQGSDVVKAIALGARAVLIGQACLYGLAAAGESGVRQVFEIFRAEIDLVLRLMACQSLAEISRANVSIPQLWSGSHDDLQTHRLRDDGLHDLA
jgi:L-lactate dehydrogenase (cytochrome)